MPKYEVKVKETEIYILTVEADNEYHARDIAWDKLMEADDKDVYFDESDGETEVIGEI